MLVQHSLESIHRYIGFIHQHVIVGRSSCSLDGDMRSQVDIVLEGMRDITIHDCTWHRVHILIGSKARWWEEANMVSLLTNNNSDLDLQNELACGLPPKAFERISRDCRDDLDPSQTAHF